MDALRFLFTQEHTLYAKVTIPLACWLAERGHEVEFERSSPRLRRFSDRYVRANPTGVAIVDERALAFVARLIGYEQDWEAAGSRTSLVRRPDCSSFDALIGTTKELDRLRRLHELHRVPTVALGYQHMPYVVRIGERTGAGRPGSESSFFLRRNAFTDAHRFLELLGEDAAIPASFTFLDRVVERRPREFPERDRVLIFHPGGYRDIVTSPGEPASVCRAKQAAFLERVCGPLLAAGLRPVIKVHPLRARHHDLADVEALVRGVEERHGVTSGTIRCLGPAAWFWDDAFQSAFVVSYGSSSLYELWSAGIKTAVVCGFEGAARSAKFKLFPSVLLDRYEEFVDLIRSRELRSLELDLLAAQTYSAYSELCDGRATDRAGELILGGLG